MRFPIAATTMLVLLLAAIGLVSSFGSSPEIGTSSSPSLQRDRRLHNQQLHLFHSRHGTIGTSSSPHPITTTALVSLSKQSPLVGRTAPVGAKSPLFRNDSNSLSKVSPSLASSATLQAAASIAEETPTTQKRSLIRRILWNANPLAGRNDCRWKGGESTSTVASRLVFSYVSPLLDAGKQKRSNNQTLTEEDAFTLAKGHRSMEYAVESLSETYHRTQTKARRNLEEKKRQRIDKQSNEVFKNSQSLVLLKALIKDQKSMLLLTGVLRLINTAVQAFPSLLVARLLRSIEAGPTAPISESLNSALLLVGVLCLKMITENQFFHNVVNMSTRIRGSLEGLIFDKSLKLPEGGSGVMTKHDTVKAKGKNKNSDENNTKEKPKKALGSGGVSHRFGRLCFCAPQLGFHVRAYRYIPVCCLPNLFAYSTTRFAGSFNPKVLNLMQSDASNIESAAMQVHTLWDGPLQISIYTYLLFQTLGSSVAWGLAVLLTVIPTNSVVLRISDRLARLENEARSARTKRTNESITHMKLLKVQTWENEFAKDILKHRRDELNRHRMRGVVRAVNSAISNAVPALVLVVTLTAYAKTGKPIKASTIFTAISLFNQLRFPLFFYPMLIDSLVIARNSLRRIASYLTSEELTPYVQFMPPVAGAGGQIEVKHGSFLWSTSNQIKDGEVAPPDSPALCNVNLKVNPGEVVAVVGSVGSGKSALVKALLGELTPVPRIIVENGNDLVKDSSQTEELMNRPEVIMHGNIGYCSQEAWVPKGTLREAVVFGRDYDEERYAQALYDAGLDQDMESGTLSSDMDVGEKGSSLSGGQRARVALARALYSDESTKVFLLDDCLAALDARVGAIVFERVTRRSKASNAATIIVTNDPSLPRQCDRVVLMGSATDSSCSTILDSGTYDELLSRGHALKSVSNESEESDGDDGDSQIQVDVGSRIEHNNRQSDSIRVVGGYKVMTNDTDCSCHADPDVRVDMKNNPDFLADRVIPRGIDEIDDVNNSSNSTGPSASQPQSRSKGSGMVSTDDKMTTQAVPLSTYLGYLRAVGNPLLVIGMVASFGVAEGARFFQQFTVSKWTEVAASTSLAGALGGQYLNNLAYAAGVVSVFLWLRSIFLMLVGLKASTFYHNRMVSSVFRAPMSFFDATPSGQLLSRFGRELEIVDRALPESFASVLYCFLQITSTVLALSGVISPAMLVPIAFAGVFYARIMKRFRPAARDMKRSEQRTRSPIFTHFGEALRGTEVIRSIPGASFTWSSRHRRLADVNLSVFSTVKALDRWLSVNLEAIGNTMVFTTALSSVFLSRAGRLQSGSAGWGLTQSLAITGLMAWAVRNLTMLESQMMSVQRVIEITDIDFEKDNDNMKQKRQMPREMDRAGEALMLPRKLGLKVTTVNENALTADGWPWMGGISFKKVSMRYNPSSPLVLNRVTLSVPPGSTLGVVGRTGSGKSSLLLTLFRIVEIESGGSIEIDGIDIRSVSIKKLRESLAIIPQDPVLFAGTLASNLDANGKATPEDMWKALQAASPDLARHFRSLGGLDSEISEGGGNLSQGQRQLICLARALIKKSKILVLDEATSSVDAQTDKQVQDTIRREFVEKGVSVITVAHRLDTVLGYDKIAVLGQGSVLEYGSPSNLLQLKNGEFRSLVDADRSNKKKGSKKVVNAI